MENTLKALTRVLNPMTQVSLTEEERWVNAEVDSQGRMVVTYKRDGISVSDKRNIEEQVFTALKDLYSEDNILVKTVSVENEHLEDNKKKQDTNTTKPANLKVGHGVVGNKKRIPKVKKVIAVSSCKGGVGKSTVSVNLALTLKSLGHTVGILDADIYGPSMPILLNKVGAKPEATTNKKIKPLESFGISFISFGLFISDKDPVIWRGPMLGGVLNQFFFDTEWGELDFLIIDLPPGTGDTQLSMVQNTEVDGAIIVSTPQTVAIADTIKGLNMFKQVNIPIMGMVENMSYFSPNGDDEKYYIFGKDGVKKAAEELDLPFLGGIPIEIEMRESADEGTPYMSDKSNQGKEAWTSYMNIAKNIDNIKKEKGFFSNLFK